VWLLPGSYGWKAQGILKTPRLAVDERALRRLLPDERPPDKAFNCGRLGCYTTVIHASYWNAAHLRSEEGLICRACASQGWVYTSKDSELLAKMNGTPYLVWGLPWRRYSQDGMRHHLEKHGAIFKIQWFDCEILYVHEKSFAQWIWDHPTELRWISDLLTRCRKKQIEFLKRQPFLHMWEHVSLRRRFCLYW
jgi:hypothetical protein